MPDFEDNLPIHRSFVERHIGQLVGIFQIDRKELTDRVEARNLETDGVVGLVAVADGGKLSETAFNVWTLTAQMFADRGCPPSNRLDFNLSTYATRLWGQGGRSATRRRRIANAFTELMRTRVDIVGIDPYTLKPAKDDEPWQVQLLEAVHARAEIGPLMDAAKRGDRDALAQLGALASLAVDDDAKATWSLVLPKWLADNVRRGHGVILDFDVQRALRGSAKRIWVQLESHSTWRGHHLPAPRDEAALMAAVNALTEGRLASYVEPDDDEPTAHVQTLVVALDDEVYEAFGLTHANRKRDLAAACRSILANDPTYLRAEILPTRLNRRRFELHLARATGALRQERTRRGMQLRAQRQQEALSAISP